MIPWNDLCLFASIAQRYTYSYILKFQGDSETLVRTNHVQSGKIDKQEKSREFVRKKASGWHAATKKT